MFLAWKVFYSVNFYIVSEAINEQINFAKKPQLNINSFQTQKHGYLIHSWCDKGLKGNDYHFDKDRTKVKWT